MKKIFWFFGLFNATNGLWMLLTPRAWYYSLPAGLPDTGPLNMHFVRDLGAAFLTLGLAFCFAAPRAARHRGVVLAASTFYGLHALIHVFDLATGHLAVHHWLLDLPGVFLPAIALAILCAPRWWPKET
jgi:hypothetical protein